MAQSKESTPELFAAAMAALGRKLQAHTITSSSTTEEEMQSLRAEIGAMEERLQALHLLWTSTGHEEDEQALRRLCEQAQAEESIFELTLVVLTTLSKASPTRSPGSAAKYPEHDKDHMTFIRQMSLWHADQLSDKRFRARCLELLEKYRD